MAWDVAEATGTCACLRRVLFVRIRSFVYGVVNVDGREQCRGLSRRAEPIRASAPPWAVRSLSVTNKAASFDDNGARASERAPKASLIVEPLVGITSQKGGYILSFRP